jgi:hypothetical protein
VSGMRGSGLGLGTGPDGGSDGVVFVIRVRILCAYAPRVRLFVLFKGVDSRCSQLVNFLGFAGGAAVIRKAALASLSPGALLTVRGVGGGDLGRWRHTA